MSQDERFQQIWDFRRNDSDMDSSSDDSKPDSSYDHPKRNKPEIVSGLVSPGNEDHHFPLQSPARLDPPRLEKQNLVRKEQKRARPGKGRKRKNKGVAANACDEAINGFTGLRDYMGSLIEGIKGARDELLNWMSKEMDSMIENDVRSTPTKRRRASNGVKVTNRSVQGPRTRKTSAGPARDENISEPEVKIQKVCSDGIFNKCAKETQNHGEKILEKPIPSCIDCDSGSVKEAGIVSTASPEAFNESGRGKRRAGSSSKKPKPSTATTNKRKLFTFPFPVSTETNKTDGKETPPNSTIDTSKIQAQKPEFQTGNLDAETGFRIPFTHQGLLHIGSGMNVPGRVGFDYLGQERSISGMRFGGGFMEHYGRANKNQLNLNTTESGNMRFQFQGL